jgi:hypothetical protein
VALATGFSRDRIQCRDWASRRAPAAATRSAAYSRQSVALTGPQTVIIGGSWGPAILDSIRAAVSHMPRQPTLQAAKPTNEPGLAGARADALKRLHASIATEPPR